MLFVCWLLVRLLITGMTLCLRPRLQPHPQRPGPDCMLTLNGHRLLATLISQEHERFFNLSLSPALGGTADATPRALLPGAKPAAFLGGGVRGLHSTLTDK